MIVALFIVLEGLAALGMIVISVHGPAGLATAAGVYFVIAAALTWWAGRRIVSARLQSVVGVALLAAAPAIVAGLAQAEDVAYKRRVAATRVEGVRDEPILSSTGRPMGVRVSYHVTVPKRGYFAILPSLYPRDPRNSRGSVNATLWTIDGHRDPRPFEPGKTHAMVVELYPSVLAFTRDGRCLAETPGLPMPDEMPPSPLRLMISETGYGNVYSGGQERLTRGSYDFGELYRAVLAEGLKPCRQP